MSVYIILSYTKCFVSATITAIFSATSVLAVTPPTFHATEDDYLYTKDGSVNIVNENGKIDAKDASIILVYYSITSICGDGILKQ